LGGGTKARMTPHQTAMGVNDTERNHKVVVAFRGREYQVEVSVGMPLPEFGNAIEAATGAVLATQKLCLLLPLDGTAVRALRPAADDTPTLATLGLQPGSRWQLYGSTAHELQVRQLPCRIQRTAVAAHGCRNAV
jgi:hypothetical protein